MSKKATTIDVLGETHLPADLLTPTLGGNYGLDGYPDMEYGQAVLEGDPFPEDPGPKPDYKIEADADDVGDIPADFFGRDDDGLGMDFTSMMREGADGADLTDLAWLEDAIQDPERLPDNPVDDGIPELEEAWGTDRRTDGINIYTAHETDLEVAQYQESLTASGKPKYKFSREQLAEVVRRAMRRSAQPRKYALKDILHEAAESLGDEAHRIRNAMKLVSSEYGLAGNVFIRASAYPGYDQGRWAKELKWHSGAEYIVVDTGTLKGSANIQDGRCMVTGKLAVTEVPWADAYQSYRPYLESTGRKVAAGGDPCKALKAAFLSHAEKLDRPDTQLPVHVTPAQRITATAARRKFKASPAPQRTVYDPDQGIEEKRLASARTKIQAWVKAGLADPKQAAKLVKGCGAEESLRRVAALVLHTKGASAFSGMPNDVRPSDATQKQAQEFIGQQQQKAAGQQAQVDKMVHDRQSATTRSARRIEQVKGRVAKVVAAIERGVQGEPLRDLILRTIPANDVKLAAKYLDPVLRKTGALADVDREARQYEGSAFKPVQQRVASVEPHVREVSVMTRWATQAMNEGFAGRDLDELLRAKFSKTVRKAGKTALDALRANMEGAAGYVFVDASAYASKAGTTGCESGSLKHRANSIKHVLAMERCATCSIAREKQDGTRVCGKYKKTLIAMEDLPSEMDQVRKANIRSANETDAEHTASLFADSYNPAEFGLHNANLNDIEFNAAPDNEQLGDVLFGGMEWVE